MMSLLEDAREIAGHSLKTLTVTGTMVCVFCGRSVCRATCVRHALPRIVAALEAIERGVEISEGHHWYCGRCNAHICPAPVVPECDANDLEDHAPDCPWLAPVAALRDDAPATDA